MVDFNSDSALSANKGHILELIILGRRDELINTFQSWKENSLANTSKSESLKYKLQSILTALFLEIDRAFYRRVENKEDYDRIRTSLLGNEIISDEELIEYFFVINNTLDNLQLIKVDTKKKYDTTEIEAENEEKGL